MEFYIKQQKKESKYNHLEKMSVSEMITTINTEDKTVPLASRKSHSRN